MRLSALTLALCNATLRPAGVSLLQAAMASLLDGWGRVEQRFVSAYNESSKRFLGSSLAVVDSAREPIKVLKILMEGLAPEDEAGLWLTNFRGVPVARSHTPFDLAYLDEDDRIIQAVEITQNSRFVPFKGSPASALILPPRTLSSSGSFTGDHILFRNIEASESERPHAQPQAGSGLFSRIVRATMVKNFNVPDEQATAAPRSGPLMRSARSLSIKPPAPTADEVKQDRLAARIAAATADTASDTPPSVQWKPSSPKQPLAPQQPLAIPPQQTAPPVAPVPTPNPPARESEPEPEVVAQAPLIAEEPALSFPTTVPLELEATRADILAQPEPPIDITVESPREEVPFASTPVSSGFTESEATHTEASAPALPLPPQEPAYPISESLPPAPFIPPQVIASEETEEAPASFAFSRPESESFSSPHAPHQEPAEPSEPPPAPPTAEPPEPQFNIEEFQRITPISLSELPSLLPQEPADRPAEPQSTAPPPISGASRPEIHHDDDLADELPAPVYAWTGQPANSIPAQPAPPPPIAEPAALAPEPEPESDEDPVSRDVAILISSNVALAAELPFVVLATPHSILYGEQIETVREPEEEISEEITPDGEPTYLRTVERKPISPPEQIAPRAKWEPDYLKRALGTAEDTNSAPSDAAPPQPQQTSIEPDVRNFSKIDKRPEPPLEIPTRSARPTPRPQRMLPATEEETSLPTRSEPKPPAPPEFASTAPPASARTREPIASTPRETPQPSATQPERPAPKRPRSVEPTTLPPQGDKPASRRARFVETSYAPQSALAPVPEVPRPEPPPKHHPVAITPQSSHVLQQAPARPTPPPPPSLAKMAKRWDVKLLYSLFPDLRPDYRPDLEQPVVNFNRDVGRTHEETQTRRMRALNWLYPDLHLDTVKKRQREVRRAPRIPVPGLVGYFFTGGKSEPHEILNISVMGFYMKTTQRWMPGTVIRITLQMIDSDGSNPTDSITVLSRVVNWDNDGGGFEFVLPGLID